MAKRKCSVAGLLLLSQGALGLRHSSRSIPTTSSSPNNIDFDRTAISNAQQYVDALQNSLNPAVKDVQQQLLNAQTEKRAGMDVVGCSMANGSNCSLAAMKPGEINLVFPGGKTRCLLGEDFLFEVKPGDPDKLLLFLEGGGACWDELSMKTGTCKMNAAPVLALGPWNDCGGHQPFENHTVIYVPNCAGDLHAGNVSHPWLNFKTLEGTVEQRGQVNMRSAVDWAKANVASELSTFAFMGESAGAIGVQLWASTLLREFKYQKAAILADSYVGVFPAGFQGPIFKDLGACDGDFINSNLTTACMMGNITMMDVYESAIKEFPNVTFGTLSSKHDIGQLMFYNMALTSRQMKKVEQFCGETPLAECDVTGAPADLITPVQSLSGADFHAQAEAIIERYSRLPNYISYYVSGGIHTITPLAYGACSFVDYSAFMYGVWGEQRKHIQDWLDMFAFSSNRTSRQSHCERLHPEDLDDWCMAAQESKFLM